MIQIKNLYKSYPSGDQTITALSNISLDIPKGEIYGIIGHSGAGKSTLIRCLNLLERPDKGQVMLDDTDITQLSSKELMLARRGIGMIFQHFNLLSSQTIFDNIAFPLRLQKLTSSEINQRVNELLELIGLTEHAHKYPAQLSGGQKQRVGIARAIANSPKVLLCDEATSALDPQTTQSILALLTDINKKLGLTIVLITHEMDVIKSICHKVAVIHDSQIVEEGPVEEIFLHPKHPVTRDFILDSGQQNELRKHLEAALSEGASLYQITYSGMETFEPHLSNIIKKTDIDFSIFSGNISHIRDLPYGQLVISIKGDDAKKAQVLKEFEARDISALEIHL